MVTLVTNAFNVVDELIGQGLHGFVAGPGDVRRQDEIGMIAQRMEWVIQRRGGSWRGNVEAGT